MSASHLPAVRRGVVAASIAIAPLLTLGGVLAPTDNAVIGFQLFLFAQVLWAVGLVGLGHLASGRSPIIGTLGAVLALLGAFGHAITGGARMLASMLPDDTVDDAFAAAESASFVPFLALGLFGTVLAYVLLGVAIIRARIAPLWVPIALFVWVAAEFALSGLTAWSPYAAMTLGVVVFIALAVCVWRSPMAPWRTESEAHHAPRRATVAEVRG